MSNRLALVAKIKLNIVPKRDFKVKITLFFYLIQDI